MAGDIISMFDKVLAVVSVMNVVFKMLKTLDVSPINMLVQKINGHLFFSLGGFCRFT